MAYIHRILARLRYKFDQTIASGTGSLLLWIAAICLAVVALAAMLLSAGVVSTGVNPERFEGAFWATLNMVLDPVVDPASIENQGWFYRAIMLFVAIFGILIVSTLIGILTSGIGEKLIQLRRGRSDILESNHTLILGWSPKVGSIIKELVIANESEAGGVVVVLADRDKVEMEEKIKAEVGNMKKTKLICRRGKPSDLASLKIVAPNTAKSFIVLREEYNDPDDDVIKAILALRQVCGSPLPSPLVAEISKPENVKAASEIEPKVSVINSNELVMRIIAQSSREPGLSRVYEEILSFSGAEIYIENLPQTEGLSFAEASMHYESAVLIGLFDTEHGANLNPPPEQLIKKGQRIIAIAEDDDQIIYSPNGEKPPYFKRHETVELVTPKPEKILILGWHFQARLLIKEYDELLPSGSDVVLIYNRDLVANFTKPEAKNSSIQWTSREGDTTDRKVLEENDPTNFDCVVVLGYRDKIDPQKADSKTLLTLIHLRHMRRGKTNFSITSEIIDISNRDLVVDKDVTCDFIASSELVSRAVAQISEDSVRKGLLDELLTAKGCEFHIRSIEAYETTSTPTFFDISKVAMTRGEIAVGYRNNGKIVFNPVKSETIKFADDAAIIVLAEN